MKLAATFKDPAQKRKAALIPVLVLGLVWMLCRHDEDSNLLPPPALNKPAPGETKTSSAAPRAKFWTELPLDQIAAFNPFPSPPKTEPEKPTEPPISAEAAREQNRAKSNAESRRHWETQSASIIYQGPNGPVAVVGNKTVGVGDLLDENLRVVDIRQEGIWVSQIADVPPPEPTNSPLSSYFLKPLLERLKILGKKFGF